jgi:hypothetical protein
MTTSTTNIADLINLLDKETRDSLSARLAHVAAMHETPKDPGQLLFEFIDEGLQACEEEIDTNPEERERQARIAQELWDEINLSGAAA